jgi:hypothetical protein
MPTEIKIVREGVAVVEGEYCSSDCAYIRLAYPSETCRFYQKKLDHSWLGIDRFKRCPECLACGPRPPEVE